ncbi:MAG: MoaD/ThiS family protein [Synechococcaceae cyanobacterium SM2_3_60]|nr:MoaD/ThiS family protein [Synechococcaceae cyanobacterium SM2_3_60]
MVTQPALTKTVTIQYVAMLREQAQRSSEEFQTDAATYLELYQQVQMRYGFALAATDIKVAVNHEFCAVSQPLVDQALVIFIPPVCGG